MTEALCSTCGIRPAQPGQRKCKECHAEYMRAWRAKRVTIELAGEDYEWVRLRSGQRKQSVSAIVGQALRLMRESEESAA